ncbi:unnamed protein product [Caenorhabditis angaria]|uniref:LITAF domain-containing protein n=1 Tax=Caenorhabditis angaria TaxID=860376 RepID=A0A9P1IH30_9PELO|nr:unnamed protein product [Caenorhabditis angaria]
MTDAEKQKELEKHLKVTTNRESYEEYCPECKKKCQTWVQYQLGNCAITILILSLVFWFPIFCFCCCSKIKDVAHYCPNCRTFLTIKPGSLF